MEIGYIPNKTGAFSAARTGTLPKANEQTTADSGTTEGPTGTLGPVTTPGTTPGTTPDIGTPDTGTPDVGTPDTDTPIPPTPGPEDSLRWYSLQEQGNVLKKYFGLYRLTLQDCEPYYALDGGTPDPNGENLYDCARPEINFIRANCDNFAYADVNNRKIIPIPANTDVVIEGYKKEIFLVVVKKLINNDTWVELGCRYDFQNATPGPEPAPEE